MDVAKWLGILGQYRGELRYHGRPLLADRDHSQTVRNRPDAQVISRVLRQLPKNLIHQPDKTCQKLDSLV